jgi:ABC-type transport system involved in multi-copper enzyme maturation permease subunit
MTLRMIKTDWLAIKSCRWRLPVMAAIIAVFGFLKLTMTIIPISAYMAIAFSVNAFAVEEKGKLDHLYLSLPLSRKSIVRGRYAFMILLLTVALIVCGVITVITAPTLEFGAFAVEIEPKIIVLLCFLGFAFGGFINLSMYPVMFRMGYAKGKIFGYYIPVGIMSAAFGAIGSLATSRFELFAGWLTYWFENPLMVCAIMFAIGAGLFFISYQLSLRLYNKRDL